MSDRIKSTAFRLHFSIRRDEVGLPGLYEFLAAAPDERSKAERLREVIFAAENGKNLPEAISVENAYTDFDKKSISFRISVSDREIGFRPLMKEMQGCTKNIERTALIKRRLAMLFQKASAQHEQGVQLETGQSSVAQQQARTQEDARQQAAAQTLARSFKQMRGAFGPAKRAI